MNTSKVPKTFLEEMVQAMDAVRKKMKTSTDQLVEFANAEPSTMAQLDTQKMRIALNVEKEPHYQWILDSAQTTQPTFK